MPDWIVSLPADLPTSNSEQWDGANAAAAIFSWAGGDNFDPAKAKKGFLFTDNADPTLRGSYKVPVARPIGGTLTVVKGGVRAAKSRAPQTDVPSDVRDRGIARLNGYWDAMQGTQAEATAVPLRLGVGPSGLTTLTTGPVDVFGRRSSFVPTLLDGETGLEGYLAPTYVLADQHLFFTEGAFAKTLKENLAHTHHLYQHWPDLILGKHVAAVEDDRGLRVVVRINEDVALGRDVMSNYRFGIPYAWSIGFDTVRDRAGAAEDADRLDRSGVPSAHGLPIGEFRAVTEARMWESSTVTWGAIQSAGPAVVQADARALPFAAPDVDELFAALRTSRLSPAMRRRLESFLVAYGHEHSPEDDHEHDRSPAAAGSDHGTRDHGTAPSAPDRRADLAADLRKRAGLLLMELRDGPDRVTGTRSTA